MPAPLAFGPSPHSIKHIFLHLNERLTEGVGAGSVDVTVTYDVIAFHAGKLEGVCTQGQMPSSVIPKQLWLSGTKGGCELEDYAATTANGGGEAYCGV